MRDKHFCCKLPFGLEAALVVSIPHTPPYSKLERAGHLAFELVCGLFSMALWLFWKATQWACIALLVGWFFLDLPKAHSAGLPAPLSVEIPKAAAKHKAALIGAARQEFGLGAPVALIAAQIHQESRWNEAAKSHAGAQGLAQFMPSTARWLPSVAPHTGEPLPFNPAWALRAVCAYDKYLLRQIEGTAASACDAWAYTLSAYNGGLKWVRRDQALAAQKGLDPARYWGAVETINAGRKPSAIKENRGYPRRIFGIQPVYERAGWGPGVLCERR